jgi:hypothetical protein
VTVVYGVVYFILFLSKGGGERGFFFSFIKLCGNGAHMFRANVSGSRMLLLSSSRAFNPATLTFILSIRVDCMLLFLLLRQVRGEGGVEKEKRKKKQEQAIFVGRTKN